ncbi:MAG: chemotaxis protein CheB [Marinilabiliaceae bacterium]|nr:chemotaxis protein CheB [Marinilabiliaceae bacterium]
MIGNSYRAIIIGGSAGSFSVVSKILSKVKPGFSIPIIICLHRLKHVRSGLVEGINLKSQIKVKEPFDKEKIMNGSAYIAPSNYHMFIEFDNTIALSTEAVYNHSRPSIDYTFSSAANVYRNKCIGILLTGANKDGANGMKDIHTMGGYTIIQDPVTCDIKTMPMAAMQLFTPDKVMNPDQISDFLNTLNND